MKFVSVPGTAVLMSVWDTRVQDCEAFVSATQTPWPRPEFSPGAVCPASNVTWNEARKFCQWLTQRERKIGRIAASQEYRLPTDAEWSAASGLPVEGAGSPAEKSDGGDSTFPWGKQWPPPELAGNYCDLSFFKKYERAYGLKPDSYISGYDDGYPDTSPVGAFPANKLGLYDMGGNVWNWCEDWYDDSQTGRVLRGASHTAVDRRRIATSFRYHLPPDTRYLNYGFRCVLANDADRGKR